MAFIDSTVAKTTRVLMTALVFAIALYLIYGLRSVIIWLGIGTFLAIIINPAVDKITKRMPGKRRGLGTAIVLTLCFLSGLLLLVLLVPPLVKQATLLVENWPQISQDAINNLNNSTQQPFLFLREHGFVHYLETHKEQIGNQIIAFFSVSLAKLFELLSSLGAIITITAMTIYMSVNGPKYNNALKRQVPWRHRKHVEELVSKMYTAVTGYITGNLLTSAIAGIAAGIVIAALGLPYAAVLGLVVAFMDLIPLVGAILGAAIVVIISVFTSVPSAVILIIFFTAYQIFEDYILVPKVMGKTVAMSSFAVFVAALAGGVLAGIVGALVAIPIGACIQILINDRLNIKGGNLID